MFYDDKREVALLRYLFQLSLMKARQGGMMTRIQTGEYRAIVKKLRENYNGLRLPGEKNGP